MINACCLPASEGRVHSECKVLGSLTTTHPLVFMCCHCVWLLVQQRQADVALSTKRLQELREEATRRQAQLESLEALYSERQESLRQTANELAWRRGELSTLESSLSESLRRQADTEYQAVEEQLRR